MRRKYWKLYLDFLVANLRQERSERSRLFHVHDFTLSMLGLQYPELFLHLSKHLDGGDLLKLPQVYLLVLLYDNILQLNDLHVQPVAVLNQHLLLLVQLLHHLVMSFNLFLVCHQVLVDAINDLSVLLILQCKLFNFLGRRHIRFYKWWHFKPR